MTRALCDSVISGAAARDRAGVFPLSRLKPGRDGADESAWEQWTMHAENAAAVSSADQSLFFPFALIGLPFMSEIAPAISGGWATTILDLPQQADGNARWSTSIRCSTPSSSSCRDTAHLGMVTSAAHGLSSD